MTPGLPSASATTSRPVSVTADRIFFADTAGSSSRSMQPAGGRLLLIFLSGDCRSRIFAAPSRDVRGGHGERLAVAAVEAGGQVAGQLQVLALVLTDRHLVGLVDEDVGGLQHRVGEQPDRRAGGALALALVLELRHPAGLAEAGQALQHPRQLHVLGHVALHEQRAARGVHAEREQLRGARRGCAGAAPPGPARTVIACRSTTQ